MAPMVRPCRARSIARRVTSCPRNEVMQTSNRAAVKVVARTDLNLVGIAVRAERKVIDKIVDGLKFHS
jgi:Uncharacterized protein conserved in bacteria